MLPLSQFTITTTIEEDTFEYRNAIAVYHLKFVPDPKNRNKCMILCDEDELQNVIAKEIDQWDVPEELDMLDMNAVVYSVSDLFGRMYFLHSFNIEITIAEMNSTPVNDTITLPDFTTTNESKRRIIKSFNSFN